ncbi:MAG: bifunctional UDP-N-acetylglucosamine diphosphorylase/glucosamine-1-phosphate N-acetyltransferase GlmU [Terriglobia bacterium]
MEQQGFTALILAAGKATRFKSEHSKMLHYLAGRPLGEYVLTTAQAALPERTYMVIGHEAAEVRKAFARPGIAFIEQKEQHGTGHALMVARAELGTCSSAHVLVLVGDAPLLRPETVRDFLRAHAASRAAATVLTTTVDDPHGYGRVIRLGPAKNNRVRAIVEERVATPAQRKIREINSGIICFSRPQLLKHLGELSNDNAQKEYLLTDLIQIFNGHGEKVMAFSVADSREVLGVNDRVELAEMERTLRRQKAAALAREGVTVVDPDATYIDVAVTVGRDTVIEPGVSLLGATRVGSGCTLRPHSTITDSVLGDRVLVRPCCVITGCEISSDVILGPFAHLRDGAVIEQDARIGNFVEVKRSRVGRGSKAWHLTYLGDATLGERVNIGAGTVTCNYDGEKKNPTIIEEGSFIGSGTMLVAPLIVGRGSYVGAGSTITESVPPESLALGRAPQVNKAGWAKKRHQPKLPISIEAREAGRVAVLDVTGRVTMGEPSKELGNRIREAVEAGHKGVLVNLAGVTYVDSSGIGELVSAFSKLRKAGGQLILTGVSKELSYLFHVANLDRVLEIVPDEAAALEKFNKPPQQTEKA